MDLSKEEKVTVLLNRLDLHTGELQRREGTEDKLFEWATTILLAVFAVIIALAGSSSNFPNTMAVKLIASFLVSVPTVIFIWRILSERASIYRQAIVIERIEREFHFFEKGYYIQDEQLFPNKWHSSFPEASLNRKTPVVYAAILSVMAICVVIAIWLVL